MAALHPTGFWRLDPGGLDIGGPMQLDPNDLAYILAAAGRFCTGLAKLLSVLPRRRR
jgi:hypothetical protein